MFYNTDNRSNTKDFEGYVSLPRLEKDLPKPPEKLHWVRRSVKSLYYRRWMPSSWQGFRFGVVCCASITELVCFVNLISTLIAVQQTGSIQGLGTFQTGDCNRTMRLSQYLHLLINLLGTLLLGVSNYCVQCPSSPTRQDVDRAHRKGDGLDIGVPSLRNLRKFPGIRLYFGDLLAFRLSRSIGLIALRSLQLSPIKSSWCLWLEKIF